MPSQKLTVEEIIYKAVNAQRMASERQVKDTYAATEKRLYSYPIIKLKIQRDREKIQDIRQNGLPNRSVLVIRHQKHGVHLTPEELEDDKIQDLEAQIAVDTQEIETIDEALAIIAGDPYAEIIRLKYFEGKSGDEIAALLSCDPGTVSRNKSRMVGRLAVFLYGMAAVI